MFVIMIIGFLAAISFGPFLILANADVMNLFIEQIFPHHTPNLFSFILRCFVAQWVGFEFVRINVLIFFSLMLLVNIDIHLVGTLFSKPLNSKTLMLYAELHVINQCGMDILRVVCGSLLASGFFVYVFSNWVLIVGWKFLPVNIYLFIVGLLTIGYFVLIETLPLAIKCNEDTKRLISKWERLIIKYYDKGGKNQHWHRICKSLRPIAIYYCMTKFDRETKRNYYANIFNNTINILLF